MYATGITRAELEKSGVLTSVSNGILTFVICNSRARDCDSLVANGTKNLALVTKFSELVASW